MELPAWIEDLWGELRFQQLVMAETGAAYQRLFQQVMKAVDGDDFVDVRPAGKHGDLKCDGWGSASRTCYAVYAPFTRKSLAEVHRKVADDFHGAMQAWPDIRAWRFVHNDLFGLEAPVAAAVEALRSETRTVTPGVDVLPPWGPKDLWWLLRRAPITARSAILGAPSWQVSSEWSDVLAGLSNDPVQIAAGRSVAQLLDNFPPGGVCDPLAATALAGGLAAFLLGDQASFEARLRLLEQRSKSDGFEAMLTAVVFCVRAVTVWEAATGLPAEALTKSWIALGEADDYVGQILLAARHRVDPVEPLPGHLEDQQHLTMILGRLTATTLRLTAAERRYPLVLVLQDLLVSVQREPPY